MPTPRHKIINAQDVMVDLETMGQVAGCPVLSIGAVVFDRKIVNKKGFYQVVSQGSCTEVGLTATQDTVDWWAKQSVEARQVLIDSEDKRRSKPLKEALLKFNDFLDLCGPDVRVWGNGSDFDNAILQYAYAAVGVKPSWKFWNNRCFRTIKDLLGSPLIKLPARSGTHHNALDDAQYQAEVACALFQAGGRSLRA